MDDLSLDILGHALDKAKAAVEADPTPGTLADQAAYLSTIVGMARGDAELALHLAWQTAGMNGGFTESFDEGWVNGEHVHPVGASEGPTSRESDRSMDGPPNWVIEPIQPEPVSKEIKEPEIVNFPTQLPSSWLDPAPPHDWVVQGCFLRNTVGMISGDGGLGKTLIGQQLCTCAALGQPWLGMETKRMKSLAIFCEDDWDELQRRQECINAHYGIQPADLEDMAEYSSMVGMDTILAEFDTFTNECKVLPLFETIRQRALDIGAQLILFDTLADIFGGNESSRVQARRFVQLLRRIAIDCNGVVVMNAHPSLTGLNTGTGTSGSTAWNNSVRSRLYLTKPEKEGEDQDTNERVLKTMKNNQASIGGVVNLVWDQGVFKLSGQSVKGPMTLLEKLDLDGQLYERLKALTGAGQNFAADPSSKTSFASLMRKERQFSRYTYAQIVEAQIRMLAANKIKKIEVGPKSRRVSYLVPSS